MTAEQQWELDRLAMALLEAAKPLLEEMSKMVQAQIDAEIARQEGRIH